MAITPFMRAIRLSARTIRLGEKYAIELLIRVEAAEYERLAAAGRVDVPLQTLRAHFLEHALHR